MIGVPGLGEVPDSWTVERARWVLRRQRRPVEPGDETVTAFRDGAVVRRSARRTEGFTEAVQEIGYHGCRRGDLVVHGMDGFAGAIGVAQDSGKVSPVVHLYRPQLEKADTRYLAYVLRRIATSGYVQSLAKGIRERSTSFDPSTLAEVLLPLPPLQEQRRIADFLDDQVALLNHAISLRNSQAAVLEERRDARVDAMTSGGTGRNTYATGSQWYPELPEGWVIRAVKHLASKIGSGKTPSGGADSYVDAGVALLRSQNVHNDGLRLGDVAWIDEATDLEMAGTQVHVEDVLYNITGASLGRCTVAPPGLPRANVNQHVCIVRCRKAADPGYVAYALTSSAVAQQVRVAQVGGNREGLNFEQLGNLRIALPESRGTQVAVRQRLAQELAAQKLLQDLCARDRDLLQERKQALVTAAVTGQLDVTTARSAA